MGYPMECIHIYIYIYIILYDFDKNPLTYNLNQHTCILFIPISRTKTHWHRQRTFNSVEFLKLPEGFRKLTRRLVCLFSVSLQFRKVPEAFRKLSRGLPEAYRKLVERCNSTCGRHPRYLNRYLKKRTQIAFAHFAWHSIVGRPSANHNR